MPQNSLDESSYAVEARSPVLSLRAAWLTALLSEPDSVLLHYDVVLAHLVSAEGEQLVLLTSASPEEIAARLPALMQNPPPGPLHVVVVGAGDELMPVLKAAHQLGQRMTLWRITPAGSLEQVAGGQSKALARAAKTAGEGAALSERQLHEAAARAALMRRDVARFAAMVGGGYPRVTTVIVAVCVALYMLSEYWGDGGQYGILWRMGGNRGELVRQGEVWRLLASTFLHGSLTHLAVNMLALLSLGRMLERVLGEARYLTLYGLSALGGALATATFNDSISVGASGAIWGVMTAGMALILRPRGLLPALARAEMKRRMWMPLILNLSISFLPRVDYYAHFGGGIVGFLLVLSGASTHGVTPLWAREASSQQVRGSLLWSLLAGLLALAMAGSIAMALVTGKPWELRGPVKFERVRVGETGISLLLPVLLEPQPVPTAIAQTPSYVYGDFPQTPIGVEVHVGRLSATPDGAEVERLLRDAAQAQEQACRNALAKPRVTSLGARRFAVAECRPSPNMLLWFYYTVLDDRDVSLTVVATAERPHAWQGAEGQIARSLARLPERN